MFRFPTTLLLTTLLAATASMAQDPAMVPVTPPPSKLGAPVNARSAKPSTVPVGMMPESLRQALVNTYNANPQIKAQQKVVEQRDEAVNQAFSGFLPRASAGYDRGRQRSRYNSETFFYGDTQIKNLQVQQPIFNGGETVFLGKRETNQVMAARHDLHSVEQQVLLRGLTAYMDVVRDRSILDLARNNVDVLRKQYKASTDRFTVGEETRTDVAQSESRLSRAESDAIQAEANLGGTVASFERVVGYSPETLAMPTAFPEIPGKLNEAIEIGERENPQLNAAQFRILAGEDDVHVSEAAILPDVTLQGTMSRQEGAGVLTRDDYDVDALTLNVSIPLYQSGAEYSRVRAAKSRAGELKYTAMNTREGVREATIQGWNQLEAAIATIRSTEDAIRAAEVALDGVTQEQLYGARSVLNILDAQQELFSAKVALVRAQAARVVSIYTLLSTVGRLNPENLGLGTPSYDPGKHFDDVHYQLIGF